MYRFVANKALYSDAKPLESSLKKKTFIPDESHGCILQEGVCGTSRPLRGRVVFYRVKKCVPNMGGTFATGSTRNPGLSSFLSEWCAPTTRVARFATIYSFRGLRSIFQTMSLVQRIKRLLFALRTWRTLLRI